MNTLTDKKIDILEKIIKDDHDESHKNYIHLYDKNSKENRIYCNTLWSIELNIHGKEVEKIMRSFQRKKLLDWLGVRPLPHFGPTGVCYTEDGEQIDSESEVEINFTITDIKKINEYLYTLKESRRPKKRPTKIESIHIERTNSSEFRIIVNEDYKNSVDGDMHFPSHKILYQLSIDGFYSDPNDKKRMENFCTYFNSTKSNKIYKRTGLSLSNVFKIKRDTIIPIIRVKNISKKTIETRINKLR